MLRLLSFLILFSTGASLAAQSDTTALSSDRPTQSASAFLVPKGTVQIESGFSIATTKVGAGVITDVYEDFITYNSTQIRFGVSNNLELLVTQSLLDLRVRSGSDKVNAGAEFFPPA